MNLSFLNSGVTTDIFARLAESLLHFVWQGGVLAAMVLLADRCLRSCSAQLRYAVHVAALLLMLACVPVTYALLERQPKDETVTAAQIADKEVVASPVVETTHSDPTEEQVPFAGDEHSEVADAGPPQSPSLEQTWDRLRTIAHLAAPYAASAYLLGVALMFSRLALALLGGHRLCAEARPVTEAPLLDMVARQARKLGIKAVPIVAWCRRTSVPLVAGLIKPMILLPVALASSLAPDQLEAILAHELAHLRRFDLLVNLLQRVAEALLFFHPAVWYVSRRISSERENCCDDSVIRAGWGRVQYADALVRMAEISASLRGINGLDAVAILAAAGNNPSQFKQRILRLLGEKESLRLGMSRGVAVTILSGVLATILAVPVLFSAPSLVAQNEKDSPQDTAAKSDREPEVLAGHYRVSFREAPWQEVLNWYERVMGDEIETKVVPEGNFNYESPRPLNHREITLLINGELLSRGFCLAQEGKGFSVQPADVIARQCAKELQKDFMHGHELRKGKDKFESYFEIVDCRIAGQTKPTAPTGPAIAYALKASRDFSSQEATAFFSACFAEVSMPSLKTGQPIMADGFAVLHSGKWLGMKSPALKKGESIEVWQNYAQEWNSRPPHDYRLVIEGSIVGEGGKPVAAARVQQLLLEEAPDGPEGEKLKEFLNWAYGGELIVYKEGKFQVALHHGSQYVRKAYLHVSAPGYAPQRVGPIAIGHEKPTMPLRIDLKPGFSGRLRLVLPDGKALDQGEVEVTVQDDLWIWDWPMAKLPVDGKPITVADCPAGPLLLKVRVPRFTEQEIRDVQLVADKVVEVKVDPKPKEAIPKEVFYFRGKEALERIESVKPAWSESQNDIEFGIARIGNRSRFYIGERVPLEMFIRNTGKATVKVQLAADFLANVPEVKNSQGEAVKVESVFATGSVALYRETLKPGEAFGFRHLGLGLGPNPAPGKENWIPFWAEPKAGYTTLRHTHEIDVDPADESKPGTRAKFTSGWIGFQIAPAEEEKPPRDGVHRYVPDPRQKDVVIEQNYKDGQLHGPTRMFVRGELSQDQNYKEGKLDGFVRRYEKGKIIDEGSWKEGKLDGFKRLYEDGKLVGETFYKNGQPEGAAFVRSRTYKMNGQYLSGQPEGAWSSERVGEWKFTTNYKHGLLDGLWERKSSDGKVIRLTYDQGQLVDQGDDVQSFAFLKKLLRLAKDGDQLAKRVKDAIEADVDLDYPGTPAAEVVQDLYERFSIPMFVDSQATDVAGIGEKKIVVNRRQISLVFGLHEMAASQELVFDYRFHALWLTTPKSAATWKDTTGVSELKPAAGSPLAKALPEMPKFDLLATPIAKLAEPFQKEYSLMLDASRAPDAHWTAPPLPPRQDMPARLSFRDMLSITLYMNKCCCREEEGKLIIEPIGVPPKEKTEPPKEKPGVPANAPAAEESDPFFKAPKGAPKTVEPPPKPQDPKPRDGVHRIFDRSGKFLLKEQNYKDGKLHGPSLQFDNNGGVGGRENYKEGKLDGFKREYFEGKVIRETFYQDGKPEGKTFSRYGAYQKSGQYLNGKPEGTWTSERTGEWKLVRNYKEGLLDGLWERKSADGKTDLRLTFEKGTLVDEGDNLKAPPFLRRVSALARADDPLAKQMMDVLHADVDLDYPQTPAKEVVMDLSERFQVPMFLDDQATDIAEIGGKKIVVNEKQVSLFFGLQAIATSQELAFDYRFHSLWLTTPKAAAAWKDPTGVSDLKPAPGSPLAKALPEPPKFDLLATPIAKLAEPLQKEYSLTLDASRAPDAKWTGWRHPSLSFRDSLSILLYQNNCRCREEGGKLIIEPVGVQPKEKAEPAKEKGAGLRINVPALGPAPLAFDFAFPVHRDGVAPGAGLRINVPALGPTPLALDFAFPINSKGTDQKQSFCFFFGVLR